MNSLALPVSVADPFRGERLDMASDDPAPPRVSVICVREPLLMLEVGEINWVSTEA